MANINKFQYIQIKYLYTIKDIINKMKDKPQSERNYLQQNISVYNI